MRPSRSDSVYVATFRRFNPNYRYPEPVPSGTGNGEDDEAVSGRDRLMQMRVHAQRGQSDASGKPT